MYGTLTPCRYTREMMRRRRHTLDADWPDRWFPIFRNIETHAGSALAAEQRASLRKAAALPPCFDRDPASTPVTSYCHRVAFSCFAREPFKES